MATFSATCPACNRVFGVPAGTDGQSVECPDCLEVFKAEKPGGPKKKVVSTQGPPAPKKGAKKPPRRRDDEDDDYDHDRRPRDDEDDYDEDDYSPPGGRRRYYGVRPPGVTLTLGILSLVFACIPLLGLILAVVTLSGPSPDVYHPADRAKVSTGKWVARATLGLYVLAVLAALGYFSR